MFLYKSGDVFQKEAVERWIKDFKSNSVGACSNENREKEYKGSAHSLR